MKLGRMVEHVYARRGHLCLLEPLWTILLTAVWSNGTSLRFVGQLIDKLALFGHNVLTRVNFGLINTSFPSSVSSFPSPSLYNTSNSRRITST